LSVQPISAINHFQITAMHPYLRFAPRTAALVTAALLALALPAATAAETVAPYAPKAPAEITLKDAFKDHFYVGVALNPGQFSGTNAQGAALVTREFNCITAENAMKWDALEPQNGQFRFEQADLFVEFGLKNNMVIIGHNLCWHSQLPGWVSQPEQGQPTLTKDVLMARLKRHIMTVAGHYKGKVKGWDVVNEAINDGEGGYRQSIFYRVIGKEFLAWAFKWAHEADPDAELYYNDYNLDANDKKRATAIELVKYLREQGAVINGIGMQCHYNMEVPTTAKIDETIGLFSELGLKVHVTELDVRANAGANAVLTGAVAGTAAGANGPPPFQGGGRRGRGPITPGRPLPPIDVVRTALVLTEAQVAAVTPLLETDAKGIEAAAGDQNKMAESRNATVAAIRKVLDDSQQPRFTLLLNPPAGGGRGPGGPPPPLTAAQQQALAKRYGEIFEVFLKHKSIARVTFWGLRDADSWRRANSPLLFDDAYGRKPAYDAVIAAVAKARN
jgi:GH35 family endo-1,4-beta-xylanase